LRKFTFCVSVLVKRSYGPTVYLLSCYVIVFVCLRISHSIYTLFSFRK